MKIRSEHPVWLRYVVALLVTAGALAVKLALVPWVTRDEPALIFLAAVLVAAGYGGFGPALLAAILAAVFDLYFFMEPFNRWRLNSTAEVLRLTVFLIEGVFIGWICARMKAARRSAEEYAAEAHELEGQLLAISEAEQRRLGHDLHDGLGQQLTGIALVARRLQETLAGRGLPESQQASKLCELANGSVEWTRDLCRSLSPPALESRGLAEALRELASHAEAMFQVNCRFEQRCDASTIDLAAGIHLYRIAQEAISNAVKHGRAANIRMELECDERAALMRVTDDGVGLAETGPTDGMGLRIMKYRARMIGADVEVIARPHGGTIVSCRYPISEQATGALNHANH